MMGNFYNDGRWPKENFEKIFFLFGRQYDVYAELKQLGIEKEYDFNFFRKVIEPDC